METRSMKRKKLIQSTTKKRSKRSDRISELPDELLHQILSALPIRTIAQTCILSKRFRAVWSTFPDLDFTKNCPDNYTVATTSTTKGNAVTKRKSRPKFPPMDFISDVLTLRDKYKHCDHLRTLRFHARLSFSTLNRLIRHAVKQNVQELDIEVVTDDYFNFPRWLVTCSSLRVFRLKSRYPGFRLLPTSIMASGFQSLNMLSLSLVILYEQPSLLDMFTESSFPQLKKLSLDACFGLRDLKIACRKLEELTIENCFQLHGLDICCPRLMKVRVASCFDAYFDDSWLWFEGSMVRVFSWEYNAITGSSCLVNMTSLEEASVGFYVGDEELSVEKLHSVCNFFSGLSHAHSLTLESQCVEVLSNKIYFAHLLHPFNNLKTLELHTGFNKNNVPGLAFLFKSSPTLHTLVLKIINDYKIERKVSASTPIFKSGQSLRDLWDMYITEEEQYWESQIQTLKPFLSHLKVVKIHGFLECENEVSLAKFLLKHGKDLEEMTLCTAHCNYRDSLRRQKVRSQMMGFSWASSNAKIAFQ